MKNILRFGLFAALATVSLSCAKETVDNTPAGEREMVEMRFTADNGVLTKTYLDGNNAVQWHEDDVIGIHDGYSDSRNTELNQQFTIESINADGSAVFKGTAAAGQEAYYATYPYDANNFITEEGKMRIGFISNQTASQPGTFDKKFNSSAAMLKDGVFNFKNVGGLLKFTLSQENVKKVTVTAKDGSTVGGVYYIYFDENGYIDDSKTTLASARATVTLSPTGRTTFAAGTYYLVISPRTYAGGMTISFTLDNNKVMTAECTSDIVIEKSKITNIGTFDTTYQEENVFTPVTFPVVFPMGYKDGVAINATTNTWVQEWTADDAYGSSKANTNWAGHHGTLHSATQPQASMKWVWDEKIVAQGVNHYIELNAGNTSYGMSNVGIKGIWTDDYFEFVLPVKDFAAGTTLSLSMSLYTREGPTFWAVEYKDGNEWKTTAEDNLPAYEGATVTAKATWALPRTETSSTANIRQTVDMTFDNAIEQGEILIRVKCVDGSIQSTKGGVNTGCQKPHVNKNNLADAPFYFWNPGNRDDQDIVIDIVNI